MTANAKSHSELMFWTAIFVLVGARLLLLAFGEGSIGGDALNYVGAAQQLVQTGQLPSAAWQPLGYAVFLSPVIAWLGGEAVTTDFRELEFPGYPGFTDNAIADTVYGIHILMDLVVVLLILLVARHFFERKTGPLALLTYAIVAIQPVTASMTNFLYPDHACTFFFFVGAWLAWRGLSGSLSPQRSMVSLLVLLAGSFFLGVSALIRVDMVPVAALTLAAAFLLVFGRTILQQRALLFVLSAVLFAVPLIGVAGLQYSSTGQFTHVSMGSANSPDAKRGGYFAWTRTWLIFHRYDLIDFGRADHGQSSDWKGFDANAYPGRAFASEEERNRVGELVTRWRDEGYSAEVDQGFQQLAEARNRNNPLRSYVLLPTARMVHYWINFEGSRAIEVALGLVPPISHAAKALMLPLQAAFFLLALIGTFVAWFGWRHAPVGQSPALDFVRLCSIMVVLRTLELGALGTMIASSLMEPRYILPAYPAMVVLAMLGFWRVGSLVAGIYSNRFGGKIAVRA